MGQLRRRVEIFGIFKSLGFLPNMICTSKKKKKRIIAAQLQKYQPIRGRDGEKEGTDVEAENRDGSINRPPCSL